MYYCSVLSSSSAYLQLTTKMLPQKAMTPRIQIHSCRVLLAMRSWQDENSSGSGVHVSTCWAIQQNLYASVSSTFISSGHLQTQTH